MDKTELQLLHIQEQVYTISLDWALNNYEAFQLIEKATREYAQTSDWAAIADLPVAAQGGAVTLLGIAVGDLRERAGQRLQLETS